MTDLDYCEFEAALNGYESAFRKILAKGPKFIWKEEFAFGCPDQCFLDIAGDDGNIYTLYLRWRHDDPWAFYIENEALRDGWYSPDGVPRFEHEHYKAAEAWAEYWYETHRHNIEELLRDIQ